MTTKPSSIFTTPARLDRLHDLAYNLWWSWNSDAKGLMRELDPMLWEAASENLVLYLHRLPAARLEAAAADPDFVRRFDAVMSRFDAAVHGDVGQTWIGRNRPELVGRPLAYFSAEFGVHRALPIYSGGLGVLAGDHIKEASDLGLPLQAMSLLYRQGYLSQRLTGDGWQEDVTAHLAPGEEPTVQEMDEAGNPRIVHLTFDSPENSLNLAIWCVRVGRVPLYLLDADVDGNPEWTRTVSSRLYGGDQEHRLRQEIILGIGGVRAFRALGVDPVYWHANEGHAAFHLLERIREFVVDGLTFDEAADRVRQSTVFTSHTPVPAGHDVFPAEMMDRYFAHYWPQLGLDRETFLALGRHGGSDAGFNLTALSMRLAERRNGVSEKHGEITRSMWHDIWPGMAAEDAPITSVTNGVHLPTWISWRITRMLDAHLGREWRDRQEDPAVWDAIMEIPDVKFWSIHNAAKRELFDTLREHPRMRWVGGGYDPSQVVTAAPFFESDVLTLGFARRFATYKRATLLFHDSDRLATILNDVQRPVQIVFAGKAHPADEGGKKMIQEIFWHSRKPRFGGRIAFAEDYDMGLASLLVAGVDIWLNNPRAPLEASGTSGMKASANGVPNLSILDGWWREGWRSDESNGWGIEPIETEGVDQDEAEANAIYEILERKVVPLYYSQGEDGLSHEWIAVAKNAMRTVAPEFSARRMLLDYIDKLYAPAADALIRV
ncbi:MAG: alpha-glucan family phosphorylase [Thermomicrobiales bacterium]